MRAAPSGFTRSIRSASPSAVRATRKGAKAGPLAATSKASLETSIPILRASILSHPCANGLRFERPKRLFGFDGPTGGDPCFSTGFKAPRCIGLPPDTATNDISLVAVSKLQGARRADEGVDRAVFHRIRGSSRTGHSVKAAASQPLIRPSGTFSRKGRRRWSREIACADFPDPATDYPFRPPSGEGDGATSSQRGRAGFSPPDRAASPSPPGGGTRKGRIPEWGRARQAAALPPASVASQAAPQALASSRTRRM